MSNRPSYADQLRIAFNKAKREKNVEAMVYYQQLQSSNTCASASFAQFKGSHLYENWQKTHQQEIDATAKHVRLWG